MEGEGEAGVFRAHRRGQLARALQSQGWDKPHKLFSKSIRALMRAKWAASERTWWDLPGPANMWPDSRNYYVKHGFEVRADCKDAHRRALAALKLSASVAGWQESCLHNEQPCDII